MPKNGIKLPSADAITTEMGQRVAVWLRREYPRDGAKLIARDLDASPHTTRRWLTGALPENRHMAVMARRWGRRFLAFVFEPATGPIPDLALDEELRELRQRLARLEDDHIGDVHSPETRRYRHSLVPAPAHPDGSVACAPGRAVASAASTPAGDER